ncbi:MAG TPA: KEOPS complex subunit Pcc1 [Methanotrichaceae archaeon]|nr:KEOPS complex subunit Pcc1 [Methanotrichaceae archaeon]
MIRARLSFCSPDSEKIARALEPDNLPGMNMEVRPGQMTIEFSVQKIGTLLSTADDLLMNLKIAEETLGSAVK